MTEKYKEKEEYNLYKLKEIMEKYGAEVSSVDYLILTTEYFAITPDAYLGKAAHLDVYFTTAGLYVEMENFEWISMCYRDICLEKMIMSPGEKGQYNLKVVDENGKGFIYPASKEICENLMGLIQELCSAVTSKEDKYIPVWLEGNHVYGEILIDFLKAGQHNTLAALKKCSEIVDFKDCLLFRQMCQYALLQNKVTMEDLKLKIMKWKNTLSESVVTVRLAILFKDLVEILQLATGKEQVISFDEKIFFEWLAAEAEIVEVDKFKKAVMFPYSILSNPSSNSALNEVKEFADVLYKAISEDILDNEKIGFWSEVKKGIQENDNMNWEETLSEVVFTDVFEDWFGFVSKKKIKKRNEREEKRNKILTRIRQILVCDFLASMHLFMLQNTSLEEEIFTKEDVRVFVKGCIHNTELANRMFDFIYGYLGDKEWNQVCLKYIEFDRRYAGDEMIKFLESKKSCMDNL